MLFWKQKDIKEIMASKYWKHECDTRLVSNYKDLIGQIQIFIDLVQPQRYHSRNIVFANKNCCISLIQFYNDQMIVYCRSTDLLRGLKCDLSWFYWIAGRWPMKIEYFTIVLGVPHRYLKDIQHKELKKGGKDNGSKR
jgi:hypothetical protein